MSNDEPEFMDPDSRALFVAADETATVDVAFLDMDANDAVDLDALFDALNIAASGATTTADFIQNDTDRGGRLIIADVDLSLGGGDDVASVADFFKTSFASDES